MGKKLIKEVFPGMVLSPEIADYFDEVFVTRVVSIDKPAKLYVDIESTHLISWENIKEAEEAIRFFVYGDSETAVVTLHHNIHLSS